ncbi:MAG: lysophospholipid acyltransferase family protein [Bacteroidales bacterium]|nr:lysophospholipid acyltransferase family protein [Bacteroidales bacterium]MBN2755669.1 lysophospholipid acyltransferase family protein [Bacteroidales bacterium]
MIEYLFTRVFIELFRFIPFRLLYLISDFSSFFMHFVVMYRKRVVYDNLVKAFPEKTKSEIREVAKKSYKNFTDITLESIKMFTMSNEEVLKRFVAINPEFLDKYYNKNQSIIGVGGHYTNWEWCSSLANLLNHRSITIYKPLNNKRLTKYFNKNRSRFGMKLIALESTGRAFKDISTPTSILLVADQSPSSLTHSIWVEFLGRDTPCIHGPEAYSKKFNLPVVYYDFQRIKRGYYTTEFSELVNNPNEYEKGEITAIYMKKLEKVIRKKPEGWLWTHKRWKHKRKNGVILKDYFYK